MSPKSRTPFTILVDTLWVPEVVSDVVTPEKFPVTIAEDIGREDNPESPVTICVEPPLLTQVPLDNRESDGGIFQPFASPKYRVAPTVNSLISGV